MKLPPRFSLLCLICLLLVPALTVSAQQPSAGQTEVLRLKIADIESQELKGKSAIVQDLYKQMLAGLYKEYAAALRLDVEDLKRMQETVKNTAADPQHAVEAQLNKLSSELGLTEEKLKTLGSNGVLSPSAPTTSSSVTSEVPGLNGSPSSFLRMTASTPNPAPAMLASVTPEPEAAPQPPQASITVCGQLRPASLTSIFAFIGTARNLDDIQKDAVKDEVTKSQLKNDCTTDAAITVGSQKDGVVALLNKLVDVLAGKHEPFGVDPPSIETVKRQIYTLNEYIGNAIVKIESEDGKTVYTAITDKDGNYTASVTPGHYYISTEVDDGRTRRDVHLAHDQRINISIEDRPVSLLARAVVGYEQTGASSTKRNQDYFFDLFISKTLPFKQKVNPDFGERMRAWTDFRFSSVPQSGDQTIGDFSGGFATQVAGLKVKDVANVFDFMAGIEYRLTGNSGLLPSFDRRTKQKFSMSFIAGAGVITPTNSVDSLTVFKVSPGAVGLPPEAVGKDFVAFVQADRDRFFRQYYAGLRLQTYFFNLFNMPMQRFPAQLDLTLGQNEFVTGGKMAGPVFKVEGYFPLPFDEMKFINIFGSAVLRFKKSTTGTPLILQPAPDGTVVPAPNVALITLPQPNRDYYRVGIGLDFISFVQKLRDSLSKK